MKKVLISAHLGRHFTKFGHSDLEVLLSMGYEVHVAANFSSPSDSFEDKRVVKHQINFDRNPFSWNNLIAYKQLKKVIDKEKYDLIHTQSPSGGVVTRIAAIKSRRKGTKVIYTSHGFHFHKSAPVINWLLFFSIEWLMAKISDCIITINNEDFSNASRFFKNTTIKYIPGIGVNTKKYSEVVVDVENKRKEFNLPSNSFVCLSVGELNNNKNHSTIIKSLNQIKDDDIYYLICGDGELKDELQLLIHEFNLEKNIKLLGHRSDLNEIYKISDVFIFPSLREGLGLASIEAMASGLPLITSNRHGIKDYSKDGKTGYACDPNDIEAFANSIIKIKDDSQLRNEFSKFNKQAARSYDYIQIQDMMKKIYRGYIK